MMTGFDDILADADRANKMRRLDRETAHLPSTIEEGIELHHQQIRDHHAAMLNADYAAANAISKEAHRLAVRLNGGDPGILASDEAPGYLLAFGCAATFGEVPMWGQRGSWVVHAAGCRVRIDTHGMFGIGASTFPSFSAHVVDRDKPFISPTGYWSFLGNWMEPEAGVTLDVFVVRMIEAGVARDRKGKLVELRDSFAPPVKASVRTGRRARAK